MGEGILTVLGGIGLFLFGMKVMTEALREAAGERLRVMLARFTATPLAGVATGAAATAVVQSSTATTVMTVGFVGAGLLTFPQALGVVFGANIGTTTTGWMVTLLGFKLQLGVVALPGLFVASLLALLGRGRAARIGRMAAGLCILFVGLDMMQAGTAGAEGLLTPDRLPGEGVANRLLLVLIGLVVVIVVQSSSVGIAMVLVLLGGGAVNLAQAVAMTIGLHVGTTFTAILASLGGSRAMRQTAMAHLLFNLGTGALAFVLLDPILALLRAGPAGTDAQTALVLFHTGFAVAGTLLFLPLIGPFARLVERLVPERAGAALLLDRALLADEGAALDAARAASGRIARDIAEALGRALHPAGDLRPLAALPGRAGPALEELERFLAQIHVPEDRAVALGRYSMLLHQYDHLIRLLARVQERSALGALAGDAVLRRAGFALGAALRRGAAGEEPPARIAARLARLSALIDRRALRHRRAALAAGGGGTHDAFRRTDAMRWLARVAQHAERIAHYHMAAAPPAPGG